MTNGQHCPQLLVRKRETETGGLVGRTGSCSLFCVLELVSARVLMTATIWPGAILERVKTAELGWLWLNPVLSPHHA